MKKNIFLSESQLKFILNESLTDTVFHFTNLNNLYYIVKNNTIFLSSAYETAGDSKLSYSYPYYLSLTRSFNNKFGYPGYKNSLYIKTDGKPKPLEDSLNVRIEFDGRLLNNNYKARPVNYHWKENLKNNQQKALKKIYGDEWEQEKDLKLVTIRQDEDRLLSKRPTIKNISKYIKRIDITLSVEGFKNYELKKIIVNLYHILNNKEFSNKIFIYDNENTFNRYHNNDFINDKIKQAFNELQNFFNNTDNQNKTFGYRRNGVSYKHKLNNITEAKILEISRIVRYISLIDNTINLKEILNNISDEILKYKCDYNKRSILKILNEGFKTTNNMNLLRAVDHLKQNLHSDTRPLYTYIMDLLQNKLSTYYKNNKEDVNKWLNGHSLTFSNMINYFFNNNKK